MLAVPGGGRAEDDDADVVGCPNLNQAQRAHKVVVLVPERFEADSRTAVSPAKWTTASVVWATVSSRGSAIGRSDSSLEFIRLSIATTSWPASCRYKTVCEPMYRCHL